MNPVQRETGRREGASVDLRSLEIFVAVAECGGMTCAGDRLEMSQSAVSQAMKHLERSLDVVLIDREVRPNALTEAGHDFYGHACRILAQVSEATHSVRRAASMGPSHLRVGLVDSFATTIGPALAHGLRRNGGGCQLLSGQSMMHAEALRRRELDIVVTSDEVLVSEAGFTLDSLLSEPVILALPADHQFVGDRLDEIVRNLELVRYSERAALGRQVALHLTRLGLHPRSSLAFDSSEAVMAMVGAGLGFALTTPLCALAGRGSLDNVRLAPLPGPEIRRHLSIGRHTDELRQLTEEISAVSLTALERDWLPRIAQFGDWLRSSIHLNQSV